MIPDIAQFIIAAFREMVYHNQEVQQSTNELGIIYQKFSPCKPNAHLMCLLVGICKSAYAEEQKVSAACQNGDDRNKGNDVVDAVTFQAEVKRIERLMYRVAWSYLGNNQDVEDAVQDAIVKAWEKRESLRRQEQFKPWLTRILVNQCKNVLRKRRKWSFFPLEEDTASVEPPEDGAPVHEALQKLKPEQRIVMTLYYVDGYTMQEIADTLSIPLGTIKTRLHSARKQLKQILLVEWEETV